MGGKRRNEGKGCKDHFFLRPTVEAWRDDRPFAQLICSIPEFETDLISKYHNLMHVHQGLSAWEEGYSSESDIEVNLENNKLEFREEDEVLMFMGFPFLHDF